MLSVFLCVVLDEIWDLIESVSEGFPTYSCLVLMTVHGSYCFDSFDSATQLCRGAWYANYLYAVSSDTQFRLKMRNSRQLSLHFGDYFLVLGGLFFY